MRPLFASLLGILILLPSVAAADTTDLGSLRVCHDLGSTERLTEVILQAPPVPPNDLTSERINHIFFDDQTENVIILASDMDFSREAESFAQFRRRYPVYWSLWLIMRGISGLWVP